MIEFEKEVLFVEETAARETKSLGRYLSPLSVWALSFGCAVGWGAFVMPGTTFLPIAGPIGTVIGIAAGALIMFIIGVNYHYLMNKYPDAGGTLTYAIKAFGYDHGFLSAWFLVLVYVAIIWANATALTLIARNLLGSMFQFGFHYIILGYDVYLGEVLLTMGAILVFGLICMYSKRLSVLLQVLLALVLFCGICFCAFAIFKSRGISSGASPAFANTGKLPLRQIFSIIALSPWAFAGFESVSNSAEGFRFSLKKTIWIMLAALICGAVAYILLARMASAVLPEGYASWTDYIADLGNLKGLKALPTFYATHAVLGDAGLVILGVTVTGGIITGLVGNYIAGSRLLYAMSNEGILPKWFGFLSKDGTPKNAVLFLMLISLPIPFLGRTAIGWIVDVNTIGATVAYGYTSAAALYTAYGEGNKKIYFPGVCGLFMSVMFFFYFMSWSANAMATESYLILAAWSILGFVFFRVVFSRDKLHRFGKSTVVWLGLLFLIFFTSLMWVNNSTEEMTKNLVGNVSEHYEDLNPHSDSHDIVLTEDYLQDQMSRSKGLQTRNNIIQMLLIVASLAIMFSIYSTMSKRENKAEVDRVKAEENSKAKSTFLSNMSHDIRTPMNAIIGYINLADQEPDDLEKQREYMKKIKVSSRHLLALINDVLEMSRIESGKMDLEPIPVDLKQTMAEVRDMFSNQMEEKQIEYIVDTSTLRHCYVSCDRNRLNRVLLNLIGNAYKFTPEGGTVKVTLSERHSEKIDMGDYELRVKDTGMGMTEEFAEKVFDAFERERTSTISKIEGSGLGMAITKNIVDLMGGTIEVITAPGEGTEIVIGLTLPFESSEQDALCAEETKADDADEKNIFKDMRLLLVEDMEINREIAIMLLSNYGFIIETAENGQEAVDMVAASAPGYYKGVLMDIQMPVMNGYEATRAIRQLENKALAEIPIVAMTANAFSEDVKQAKDAGMNAHVAKPIDVGVLESTLKEVLC